MEEARELGNIRTFNVVILGVAAQYMEFSKEDWLNAIEAAVPPKTVEINKKAFVKGYNLNALS
jgi:indolepyruvate ferredoxin oxidoreductase beta subunit